MDQQNIIETALSAAALPQIEQLPDGTPVALLPTGNGAWKLLTLPEYSDAPARKSGAVTLDELDSFLAFVDKHRVDGSQIYVRADYASNQVDFTAVLNGHTGEAAGFADFKAKFEPRKTVDWQNWLGSNAKKMGQEDFAQFLETNIASIAETNPAAPNRSYPSAATLLEFCTNLEMTSTVRFRSATKVQNGQVQFEYVEEGDSNTKGKLELFETFGVGVQPFIGTGPAFFLEAKLRFRIDRNSGQLSLWYELQRPDKALEKATTNMIERVKTEADVPVFFGRS